MSPHGLSTFVQIPVGPARCYERKTNSRYYVLPRAGTGTCPRQLLRHWLGTHFLKSAEIAWRALHDAYDVSFSLPVYAHGHGLSWDEKGLVILSSYKLPQDIKICNPCKWCKWFAIRSEQDNSNYRSELGRSPHCCSYFTMSQKGQTISATCMIQKQVPGIISRHALLCWIFCIGVNRVENQAFIAIVTRVRWSAASQSCFFLSGSPAETNEPLLSKELRC